MFTYFMESKCRVNTNVYLLHGEGVVCLGALTVPHQVAAFFTDPEKSLCIRAANCTMIPAVGVGTEPNESQDNESMTAGEINSKSNTYAPKTIEILYLGWIKTGFIEQCTPQSF